MSSPLRVEKSVETPAPEAAPQPKKGGVRRIFVLGILALMVIVGAFFGFRTYLFYEHHATTEDAQIDGHIDPVLPRVSGYVSQVLVSDNQPVKAGDVLVRIDTADLQAKVDQEQASLLNAQAAVSVAQAALAGTRATLAGTRAKATGTQADVAAARTRQEQAAADLARYTTLWKKEEISQQQYDAARAAADSARAGADAARATAAAAGSTSEAAAAQIDAASRQIAAAEAQVAQHRAALESAKLQLSYAVVTAPTSGVVSKKAVELGQFVQAGQPLLAIVQGHDTWVSANFKETQLAQMRPGQTVDVEVDAYPGHTFHGRVESLAAATGARFSLLPPDNATGNFTKVVQRVPVKIVFTDPPDPQRPLRVGMNVSVVVNLD
ncbi:MAG: rane fusion protein multidrug efflux system [Acidobacteriota bacterium]|jgi:membrane fusion protein (multidrug efflux system)|nr:rane fusion protein multidrug efflux system [Acidobacteriota bacterium]